MMESDPPRIDKDSQEELWSRIESTKVIEKVEVGPDGSINSPPTDGRYLKVVCVSDTHEQFGQLLGKIPDGDVLIHAGDITQHGERESYEQFNQELGSLPHKHKLIVAGNHDYGFEEGEDVSKRHADTLTYGTPDASALITNGTWLQDRDVVIEGIKFFGSSWHPLFGYPFYRPRPELKEKWRAIPEDCDVLITHSPPLGYQDKFYEERWGCAALLEKVEEIKPQFHVFGHVHAQFGVTRNRDTTFVNAAQCGKNDKVQLTPQKLVNRILCRPLVFYVKCKSG